jgi:hypothetical protein
MYSEDVESSNMQVRRFSCCETAQRCTVATRTRCKIDTWRFLCNVETWARVFAVLERASKQRRSSALSGKHVGTERTSVALLTKMKRWQRHSARMFTLTCKPIQTASLTSHEPGNRLRQSRLHLLETITRACCVTCVPSITRICAPRKKLASSPRMLSYLFRDLQADRRRLTT